MLIRFISLPPQFPKKGHLEVKNAEGNQSLKKMCSVFLFVHIFF